MSDSKFHGNLGVGVSMISKMPAEANAEFGKLDSNIGFHRNSIGMMNNIQLKQSNRLTGWLKCTESRNERM